MPRALATCVYKKTDNISYEYCHKQKQVTINLKLEIIPSGGTRPVFCNEHTEKMLHTIIINLIFFNLLISKSIFDSNGKVKKKMLIKLESENMCNKHVQSL